MGELAHHTDTNSKQNSKVWYDRTSHLRSFKEGGLVLVLMPDAQDKLSAHWQDPYSITKQVSSVSYELETVLCEYDCTMEQSDYSSVNLDYHTR